MFEKDNNVFDEALDRIRFIYDNHEDVIVFMSGGKDSTVLFHLALQVASERNRLPLKVFWLDQEAEWQGTVDYMDGIMRRPDVKPYWYQIPFDFTNSLSNQKNFIHLWDKEQESLWVHPQSDISIKENPTNYNRFHKLIANLQNYCTESQECAVLVGMRTQESPVRRMAIAFSKSYYKGITWALAKKDKTRVFYPIYDFTTDDIWIAIARNKWKYNNIYDKQYRYGISKDKMRVSALIHETAWYAIEYLQTVEPETYDRFTRRIAGVSTFGKLDNDVMPKELPFAFSSWLEYRDYLLEKIVKPEYRDLFRSRWEGKDDEDWYRMQVKECIINDIDGTLSTNHRSARKMRNTAKYYDKGKSELVEYIERKRKNDK